MVEGATETDDESLVGDACHIVADSPGGPRGKEDLDATARDKYANLILLCKLHHKIVDDQPGAYTSEKLRQMKADHVRRIDEQLTADEKKKLAEEEVWADYIDYWSRIADLDNWRAWTSGIFFAGQPRMKKAQFEQLDDLRFWILNRVWPKRHPQLKDALQNFGLVLSDFLNVFQEHAEPFHNGETLLARKFYKIDRWDEELYHKLVREYEFHVALVEDLALELTRAANFLCDGVREFLQPTFRLKQGALLIDSGLDMELKNTTYRPEYRPEERTENPYPGLERFFTLRGTRDVRFGKGAPPTKPAWRR